MKDHLGIHNVIKRVRSASGTRSRSSSTGSAGSRGSRGSNLIRNHGEFKLLVIGGEGVGKSSICRTYAGLSSEDDDMCLTNDGIPYDSSIFIDQDDEVQQYDLEIFDYKSGCSLVEHRKIIEKCDGFLFVYSKTSKNSLLKLVEIKSDVVHFKKGERGVPPTMLAVGNKSDVDDHTIQVDDLWSLDIQNIDVSAKKNEGLQTAFNILVKECVSRKNKLQATVAAK